MKYINLSVWIYKLEIEYILLTYNTYILLCEAIKIKAFLY